MTNLVVSRGRDNDLISLACPRAGQRGGKQKAGLNKGRVEKRTIEMIRGRQILLKTRSDRRLKRA